MANPIETRAKAKGPAGAEAPHLRRSLGYWQLTAIGFSGVIGSGWLLGAMYAAQAAGPESLFAWVLGAVVLGPIPPAPGPNPAAWSGGPTTAAGGWSRPSPAGASGLPTRRTRRANPPPCSS